MPTILVPIDFSGATAAVIAAAVALRKRVGAKLILLHVIAPPVATAGYGLMPDNLPELMVANEQGAITRLKRLKADLVKRKIPVTAFHAMGMPASVITDEARKRRPAYIVLGSHGHTAVYDLLVGSTTHVVLKHATCPVVVVPLTNRGQPKRRR